MSLFYYMVALRTGRILGKCNDGAACKVNEINIQINRYAHTGGRWEWNDGSPLIFQPVNYPSITTVKNNTLGILEQVTCRERSKAEAQTQMQREREYEISCTY